MLRAEDFRGDTWKRLMQALTARLAELRDLNDRDHDLSKTAAIRGQITEVKRMLALSYDSAGTESDPFE